MKKLLVGIFFLSSLVSHAQIVSFVYHGDTLIARNPLTGDSNILVSGATAKSLIANISSILSIISSNSGTNTGDNSANSNYASDYRASNFVAGTNYLAPSGSAALLTNFPTLNQNTTGSAATLTTGRTINGTSFNGSANIVIANASAATSATTGTMSVDMSVANQTITTITPTAACTFNASGGNTGYNRTFFITTSGTSSFTLTWSTNFHPTATLATGTVSAKHFCVTFLCVDGVNWYETARSTAE